MSYEILYRRLFVKLSDTEIIPIVEAGSNNVYEATGNGRKRSRYWQNFSFISGGKTIVSPKEIETKIDTYRQEVIDRNAESNKRYVAEGKTEWVDEYSDKMWGYFTAISIYGRSTRGTSFNMYKNYILNGIKEAVTVEELAKNNIYVSVNVSSYVEDKIKKLGLIDKGSVTANSTEHLRKIVAEFEAYYNPYEISFWADLHHAYSINDFLSMRSRERGLKRTARGKTDWFGIDHYVLHAPNYNYFYKKTKYGFRYTPYKDSFGLKRFKTFKQAESYIKKYNLQSHSFTPKLVEKKVEEKVAQ